MFKTLVNIFRVPELRDKVLFTFFMLLIYRIGFHVPIPGVDQQSFQQIAKNQDDSSAAGRFAAYASLFSGGNLQQSTIFGLGIMPYISSSIIFQLLGTVVPSLEKLQKEGEAGRKKIQEWSRYTTVLLCIMQAFFWLTYMEHAGGSGTSLILPAFQRRFAVSFWLMGVFSLTAGSIFLMWLGEQIDEYGLGNGVSLVILAGIVARMPNAVGLLIQQSTLGETSGIKQIGLGKIIALVICFVSVVMGSILITQAQRRIPIQQAKHTRGRRVYGGQKQFLPLRVNHGGVMPIIFAQSIMLFPGFILSKMTGITIPWMHSVADWLNNEFRAGYFLYLITEAAMIYFFAYFWTTVQFQPKEMANQLRDYGSFIPGLRPGKRTADYLEKVMMRITYVGAAFLCVIAVVPTMVTTTMNIDPRISAFLGGTGLLIVVNVALDMVQRIEANLLMRNYGGFLGGGAGGGKGKRIKGQQYSLGPHRKPVFPMPIVIKSRFEIERMRRSGQLGHQILTKMRHAVAAGVTTQALDDLAKQELDRAGAIALSKNYPTYRAGEGFPGHTCISVNEEVVHGIPGMRTLKDGDIVTLDLALSLDGYCADTATTVGVGTISAPLQQLLTVTRQTLDLAISHMRPGIRWSDVARLMQHYVEQHGYNVVREFVGHGIGREMHEEPKVPNFVTAEQLSGDFTLRRGMTLAVEPMVVMGARDVDLYKDGWTVFTVDRMPAAHFEHTVAVTETGVDILTDGTVPAASTGT